MTTTQYGQGACTEVRPIRVSLRDGATRFIHVPWLAFADWTTERAWSICAARAGVQRHHIRQTVVARISNEHATRMDARRALSHVRERTFVPFLDRVRKFELTPDKFRYDRAVGVEIECCGHEILPQRLPLWLRQGQDGSVETTTADREAGREPREYRMLLKRNELEVRLYRACKVLADCAVNKTCGLHVHLDMRGRTENEVWLLARKLNKWLYALREFVPESRRNNRYCRFGVSRTDRYHAVNFTSFSKYGTLEVRLHSGTVDYAKIIAWIRLLELLVAYRGKCTGEGVACMLTLPLVDFEQSYWRARHRVLNPSQYRDTGGAPESE
jgi:hypothetical protein